MLCVVLKRQDTIFDKTRFLFVPNVVLLGRGRGSVLRAQNAFRPLRRDTKRRLAAYVGTRRVSLTETWQGLQDSKGTLQRLFLNLATQPTVIVNYSMGSLLALY